MVINWAATAAPGRYELKGELGMEKRLNLLPSARHFRYLGLSVALPGAAHRRRPMLLRHGPLDMAIWNPKRPRLQLSARNPDGAGSCLALEQTHRLRGQA